MPLPGLSCWASTRCGRKVRGDVGTVTSVLLAVTGPFPGTNGGPEGDLAGSGPTALLGAFPSLSWDGAPELPSAVPAACEAGGILWP